MPDLRAAARRRRDRLVKYWFSVSDEEQERRFRSRLEDPLRSWKLSPMDLESRARWVEYSKAKDEMFVHTDIREAPWYVVEADDKRRARLNCIHHLLSLVPYEDVVEVPLELPRRPSETGYRRPPRDLFHYVPDHTASLLGASGDRPEIEPRAQGDEEQRHEEARGGPR